jgi:hypothetical protein
MVELRGSWVGRRPRWITCVVLPLSGSYPARAETSVITLRGEERRYFPAAFPAPVLVIGLRSNSAGAPGARAQNYEVSATPRTESETCVRYREALQKPCCTKPRAASRRYGDLTATYAGAGWNCPICRGRNASSTTAQRVLDEMAERIGQTFGDNVLRIAEVNRHRSRAAPRPPARSNCSFIWCANNCRECAVINHRVSERDRDANTARRRSR